MEQIRPVLVVGRTVFQSASLAMLSLAALCATSFTVLAAGGLLPWLHMPLIFGDTTIVQGGVYVQLGVTALLLAMCFFVPTNRRVLDLETAHRDFSLRMEDVARAYASVHAADRAGVFQMSSEFDAVKERILHLRNHPDLSALEPDIMEVAAQMSRISEELAQTYADARVDRAYDFLRQRQQEVDAFQERLDHAKALHADIRQWANRLEVDEAVAKSQLNRMIDDLQDILPDLDIRWQAEQADRQGVLRLAAE
ncbi:DNA repair protein [uncultured Roseobacter sp.]|uniref:DNA repair protein n=1 Tax=uncultured Roseobacter sp. TaxID=114847 RepID=UPI0026151F25|nr:DNA repair protein [uncultured Roseobacter sp.]